MATLKDIVANHIPIAYRMRYDFETHWIPWINNVLKLIPQIVNLDDNVEEVGVEVVAGRWITPPARCRKSLEVYQYDDKNAIYKFDITNKKLKLRDGFSTSLVRFQCTFEVATGGLIRLLTITPQGLPDYSNTLLVTSDNSSIIICSEEVVGGNTLLTPLNPITGDGIIDGYIIPSGDFLLLKCVCDYPDVATENDEVPLSDKYEKALSVGLRMEIMKEIEDLSQINLWLALLKWELGLLDLDSGLLKELKKLTRDEVQNAPKA